MKKTLLCIMACLCLVINIYSAEAEQSIITTNIRETQCGTTIPALNTLIAAVCPPQATAYRFEVTDTGTNGVQTLERSVHYFSLTMLPFYDYATTYSIRVELQINGVWQGEFGSACDVSSPAILGEDGAAKIIESQCDTYVENINKLIATTSLPGVTSYRFRITNEQDADPETHIQVIDRQFNWFSLTMLHKYNYGARYTVEVAVKTTGDYSDFGAPCIVGAPEVPILVSCGATIQNSGDAISTLSLSKVASYRFEVTDLNSLIATTIDRPVHWFTFDHIPDYNPGASYGVRIALLTNGSYSDLGDACEIFSPPNSRIAADTERELSRGLIVQASPNPFVDSFSIKSDGMSMGIISIKTFDMTGRLLEATEILPAELTSRSFGAHYPTGVYNIVISEGENVKSIKVIKR